MIDVSTIEPLAEAEPDAAFWSQREILTHVHTFARSRSVAPYAVLGCTLRRAIGCTEPNVKLPPIVGGAVSVNLFTGSAGRSGQGKDSADAAGFDAVFFPGQWGDPMDADRPNIGTGEGLARIFKGSKDTPGTTRAHLIVPEVNTLAALAGRQGATLPAELLKAYMGQPLGFNNSHKETTTAIEAHSYRLCLGVGVQPENADFFFAREKDGLPQRFLWLPTNDPYAPRVRPPGLAPKTVCIPGFGSDEYLVGVPSSVQEEILDHRHLVLTGSDEVDPLDGHVMLTRLKVAFGLALLDERQDISEGDWHIAGQLLVVSANVRINMQAAVADSRRRQNTARAHEQAQRQVIVETQLTGDRQARVASAITRKLKRSGRASRSVLRRVCDHSIRHEFDPVFDVLLEKQIIAPCDGDGGEVDQYVLGPEYRRSEV